MTNSNLMSAVGRKLKKKVKLNNLNHWLALITNVGVLIGVVAVVVELRQTRAAMDAEASTVRAQIAIGLEVDSLNAQIHEVITKLTNEQELTPGESARARMWIRTRLRHFENMHYQYQIGVLGEEIWQAALQGLGSICSIPIFKHVYPNWDGTNGISGFRDSFAEVVAIPCS